MIAACSLAAASGTGRAGDVLLTRNGRLVTGRELERGDGHVLVHFANGKLRVPDELILEVFLADEAAGSTPEAWAAAAQLEDASAHQEWGARYQDRSGAFAWNYTIPTPLMRTLRERAEDFFQHFRGAWQVAPNRRQPPAVINLYRDALQYQRVSGASSDSKAYFMFVGRYELNLSFDRGDPGATQVDLYRMLSYYLQKLLNEEFRMPPWPGESVADYHGAVVWNEGSGGFEWGALHGDHLRTIQRHLAFGNRPTIEEIVTGSADGRRAWGWALVHFLLEHDEHAPGFRGYLLGLARDPQVQRVEYAFGLETVVGEESLRYLAQRLGVDGQDGLAAMQPEFYRYLEGLQLQAPVGLSAVGHYRQAQLLHEEHPEKARGLYRRATELDPLEGQFWFQLSRLTEDVQEAARLQALARELGLEPID